MKYPKDTQKIPIGQPLAQGYCDKIRASPF